VLTALMTFAAAAALIVLLPGPDTLVVVRNIARGGRARGTATAAGVITGLAVWVVAAALGLSALLRASEVGYNVLRFAGAAYLLWLAVQSFRSRGGVSGADDLAPAGLERAGRFVRNGFSAGLITDLLNPKVGVFFVTFLPAFIPHGAPVGWTTMLLGAVFIGLTVLYFVALLGVARTITDWLARPRTRRRLEVLTGTVLLGFGVRLATES
jgi:threonine/homoserine/homoserine lactone efflux protein